MASDSKIPMGLITIVGGAFAVYYFGKKIKELFTGSTEQIKELQTFGNLSYWNTNFWNVKGAYILTHDSAMTMIKLLNEAPGVLNDNEEKVYSVFRSLKTKSQVSYLAYKWAQGSNHTLYDYLTKFLNDKELYTVKKIIDSKPNYKP